MDSRKQGWGLTMQEEAMWSGGYHRRGGGSYGSLKTTEEADNEKKEVPGCRQDEQGLVWSYIYPRVAQANGVHTFFAHLLNIRYLKFLFTLVAFREARG